MNSSSTATFSPSPKAHYEVLDGLRGIAALVVVAFHVLEPNDNGVRFDQIINHGYLAVDFFFLLSGFVIAYAYDNRWPSMSSWEFYKRRLIRLQPMVIMGTCVGAITFYFGKGQAFPLIATTSPLKLFLVMLLGFTMLPLPYQFDIRGWYEMHPLDGPSWSLFFEYIANILYAVGIRKLSLRWLSILTVTAGLFLLHLTLTGEGDVIGGWSLSEKQLHIGFARLLYPFLAGVLLMRSGFRIALRWTLPVCCILLILCLFMPRFGGSTHLWINGLYEALCILFIFPLIVAMGASQTFDATTPLKLCRTLGDLSYPLYITHYPLIYLYTAWMWKRPHTVAERTWVGVLIWCAAVSLAYGCLEVYDKPVRAWLTQRFLRPDTPVGLLHVPGNDPIMVKPK